MLSTLTVVIKWKEKAEEWRNRRKRCVCGGGGGGDEEAKKKKKAKEELEEEYTHTPSSPREKVLSHQCLHSCFLPITKAKTKKRRQIRYTTSISTHRTML